MKEKLSSQFKEKNVSKELLKFSRNNFLLFMTQQIPQREKKKIRISSYLNCLQLHSTMQ